MLRRVLAPITLAAAALASPALAAPSARVVVLNGTDPTLPAFIEIDKAMRAELASRGGPAIELFQETLDMLRFPSTQLEPQILALMRAKYGSRPPDVVVAVTPAGLDFAERHRAELWPRATIVFHSVPEEVLRNRALGAATTGIPVRQDLVGTLALARRLVPEARKVIAISGTGDFDQMMERVARSQLAAAHPPIPVEYWADRTVEDVLAAVAKLPRDTIVLYLSVGRDRNGRTFVPREVLTRISEASGAPVFGAVETFLGNGIAAGSVDSHAVRGRRVGELVHAAIREGKPPPYRIEPTATCAADARQLLRWGMDARRLPDGCNVLFAELSAWERYRWQIVAGLAVIVSQSALIAGLLMQRHRRRRAEDEVHATRASLVHANRLAAMGEITASIAHEIKQPLSAILANVDTAEILLRSDDPPLDDVQKILAAVRRDDRRACDVISRLREVLGKHEMNRRPLDLNNTIAEALQILDAEARRRGVAIAFTRTSVPAVSGDRVHLLQVVVNLVMNAMDALAPIAEPARRITLRAERDPAGVAVSVSDNGPGIAPDIASRLFESFATTKATGMGLGLSIARSIVEAHDGTIAATTTPGGGATFRFVLPLEAGYAGAAPARMPVETSA